MKNANAKSRNTKLILLDIFPNRKPYCNEIKSIVTGLFQFIESYHETLCLVLFNTE